MFIQRAAKGLDAYLVARSLDPDRLTLHVSEIGPGARAHPPHTHGGVEAFYVLDGRGTLVVGDERVEVGPNEAIVLDPEVLHGLVAADDSHLRYMVIISRS